MNEQVLKMVDGCILKKTEYTKDHIHHIINVENLKLEEHLPKGQIHTNDDTIARYFFRKLPYDKDKDIITRARIVSDCGQWDLYLRLRDGYIIDEDTIQMSVKI